MPVVFTEYLKTASARSPLSRTACQRALSELNWGTLLRVADVEIVFILQRYHCRLWQKLRFLLSNSANLPRGPLSHFPTESPRLESRGRRTPRRQRKIESRFAAYAYCQKHGRPCHGLRHTPPFRL